MQQLIPMRRNGYRISEYRMSDTVKSDFFIIDHRAETMAFPSPYTKQVMQDIYFLYTRCFNKHVDINDLRAKNPIARRHAYHLVYDKAINIPVAYADTFENSLIEYEPYINNLCVIESYRMLPIVDMLVEHIFHYRRPCRWLYADCNRLAYAKAKKTGWEKWIRS